MTDPREIENRHDRLRYRYLMTAGMWDTHRREMVRVRIAQARRRYGAFRLRLLDAEHQWPEDDAYGYARLVGDAGVEQ